MWGTPVELTEVCSTGLQEGSSSAVLQSELLSSSARAAMQTETSSLSMLLAVRVRSRCCGHACEKLLLLAAEGTMHTA